MSKVFGQLVKLKPFGDRTPRLAHRLKRTQKHLSCVFFVIRTFIRNPKHGHLRQTSNRLGDNIKMFAGL